MNATATNLPVCDCGAVGRQWHLPDCPRATAKPILEPRHLLGLEQLKEISDELDAAIAWAHKPFNREKEIPDQPMLFGRNLRRCAELLTAARANLIPAPADTVPSIIREVAQEDHERAERKSRKQADLFVSQVPAQSRPAFANRGAR